MSNLIFMNRSVLEDKVNATLVDSDGIRGADIALILLYRWINDNQHEPEMDAATVKCQIHRLLHPEWYV